MRYWADRTSHFDTLADALEALALRYGRSVQWVEAHMGEENDLGRIHARLLHRHPFEMAAEKETGGVVENIKVGDDSQWRAGSTPADSPPPQGGTAGRKLPRDAPVDPMSPPAGSVAIKELAGISFYDPRRPGKYWVGLNDHYNTLDAALQALAVQHGTTIHGWKTIWAVQTSFLKFMTT